MLRWLWLSAGVLVADQATKIAADRWLMLHDPVALAPVLNLTLSYNTGAAFSLLAGAGGWQRWLFAAVAIVVSVLIIGWLRSLRSDERWTAAALALILGGAIGNLIDRLLLGYVIDFVDAHYGAWHWPAFNVADSAITVGVAIIIVTLALPARRGSSAAGR